ncbi:MAG: SulP family inorganic anion transporter, partial [Acidobacteriota bacterium]|nr:SulP family inorganic anion transporter [Acidobacteriota bacterium]
ALALGALLIMIVGERWSGRWPWALVAIGLTTLAAQLFTLRAHGVRDLGSVSARLPSWRLSWLTIHEWGVVCTTALTLIIVVLSQSAVTSRAAADELGVADDLNRDFVGVGLANVAAGLVGAFPVDASPARTTIVRLAGGRTRIVGLVAVVLALVLSPLASFARVIPLAALAGVLFFIAGRLVNVARFLDVWRSSRVEFAFAMISLVGVVLFGVELGLAIAVALAVVNQTWRSSRPHLVELGRREGTTSWEPLRDVHVRRVPRVLVVLFDQELFFANAGAFRRLLHQAFARHPRTSLLVLDAVAISDVDYTATNVLEAVLADLHRDGVHVALARANELVRRRFERSSSRALRHVAFFDSVDEAVHEAPREEPD